MLYTFIIGAICYSCPQAGLLQRIRGLVLLPFSSDMTRLTIHCRQSGRFLKPGNPGRIGVVEHIPPVEIETFQF